MPYRLFKRHQFARFALFCCAFWPRPLIRCRYSAHPGSSQLRFDLPSAACRILTCRPGLRGLVDCNHPTCTCTCTTAAGTAAPHRTTRHNIRQAASCTPSSNSAPPAYHASPLASRSLGTVAQVNTTTRHNTQQPAPSAAQHNNAAHSFIPVLRPFFADGRRFFVVSFFS